jgi:hypothetical protein
MNNGNGPAPAPAGGAGPGPNSDIVGGWRSVAAFVFILLTFAVLFWLMYEAVVDNDLGAYCKVRAFFLPLCLLAFTILGVFVGGWAEAAWHPPGASALTGLAARAGGGAAFFLISAGVLFFLAAQEDCQKTLSYSLSFEKPEVVTIEPDHLNGQWYQHVPQNERVTHGKLFYVLGPDQMDRDPFDELTFGLNPGSGGTLCPIVLKIYNRRSSFKRDCHQAARADALYFKLSDDLVGYASKLASQSGGRAPIEAAVGGPGHAEEPGRVEEQGGEKECFAEISAADKSVTGPFKETFKDDGLNASPGGHITVFLYKGEVCIDDGTSTRILPPEEAAPRSSWFNLLDLLVPKAHAASPKPCPDNKELETVPFDQLLESLASDEPEKATATLVEKYRVYECKIYDVLLQDAVGPNVAARLLKIIALAPIGWSNNQIIENDSFPDLRPNDKAKAVFDRAIQKDIVSDNDELRRQARKLLTTYPVKYVRDKYEEIDIDALSLLRQAYFSYAGIFLYFRPVISGDNFSKEELTPERAPGIMSKIITEYEKGIALRRYLDEHDKVDSYILDYGLGSTVHNFEKADAGAFVPDRFKPSQNIFRAFLNSIRVSRETYPFNNQLGWATCFAFTPPTERLPLTLDDAEWFKGEPVTVSESTFVLEKGKPTFLKACPGPDYADTSWSVDDGESVHRLLRKADDAGDSWLFVRAVKGYGWLKEQPENEAKHAGS